MKKLIFIVEMQRNNDNEQHSYVIGAWDDEVKALTEAWSHMKCRAGKYGAEVSGYEINGGDQKYKRTLDCWDAFAAICKDTAEKVQKMLDADGL